MSHLGRATLGSPTHARRRPGHCASRLLRDDRCHSALSIWGDSSRSSRGDLRALKLYDESALADAYAVECEATRRARPGWVPLGEKARVAAWRADNGWIRELVGASENDRLIGFACSSTAHDTPNTSWVSVSVVPRHQRRRVGTRLVQAVETRAQGGHAGSWRAPIAPRRQTSKDWLDRLAPRRPRPWNGPRPDKQRRPERVDARCQRWARVRAR